MPVQIGWLEMGWQLRPNEVEEEETTTAARKRERQTQRKEKRVRWMTKRNEGVRMEGGGTRKKEEEGTSAIMSRPR